jgi:hypothetical protein
MNACRCGAGPQSSITFDGSVEMLRCRLCGATSWLLDGQEVAHETAHAALRGTFVSTRRQAPVARTPRPPRVVDLREPASAPPPPVVVSAPTQDVDGALAALLKAKGISGSWAVSGS